MYYFFSFPNLHLFNQFDNCDFSTIKQFEKNLLLNYVDERLIDNLNTLSDKKRSNEESMCVEVYLNDIFENSYSNSIDTNKLHPFDLFSKLITILPSLAFLKLRLTDSNSFRNRFIDYLKVKHILNFNLDMNSIKDELDKLSETGEYIVNYKRIFKDLFLNYYKYGFVNIAENLKIETDQRIINLNINDSLKSYKVEYKKYYSKKTNNKEFNTAEKFIINLQQSIKQSDYDTTIAALNEMKLYSNVSFLKKIFAKVLIENIEPKAPTTKRKYHLDLRYFFNAIIRKLFYEHQDPNIDLDELVNLQKKLFNKIYQNSSANFKHYFKT